jgi:hypothetical protein
MFERREVALNAAKGIERTVEARLRLPAKNGDSDVQLFCLR